MDLDQPPVVRVGVHPDHHLVASQWPATIPAVAQVLRDGLDLTPGVTFLVGENGSGKSTLVEAVAVAYGLSPEGGDSVGEPAAMAERADAQLLQVLCSHPA